MGSVTKLFPHKVGPGKTSPANIWITQKVYHWAYNAKGNLVIHSGTATKCRRVHR